MRQIYEINSTIRRSIYEEYMGQSPQKSIFIDFNWGNVTEIMYDVGFSNLSYFSKCFKAEFGLNPKDYQQQMSKSSIEINLAVKD